MTTLKLQHEHERSTKYDLTSFLKAGLTVSECEDTLKSLLSLHSYKEIQTEDNSLTLVVTVNSSAFDVLDYIPELFEKALQERVENKLWWKVDYEEMDPEWGRRPDGHKWFDKEVVARAECERYNKEYKKAGHSASISGPMRRKLNPKGELES